MIKVVFFTHIYNPINVVFYYCIYNIETIGTIFDSILIIY